jgi:hypothetical protein
MAIGSMLIAAGGLGLVPSGADVVGLALMVFGALGAAVALEPLPRPARQPVEVISRTRPPQ